MEDQEREAEWIRAFSDRLFKLREAKGVSARSMSYALGQEAHNYINSIEAGKFLPAMLMFYHICDYLEITPQQFFDNDDEAPHITNELLKEVSKLDVRMQEKFLELIREINKST